MGETSRRAHASVLALAAALGASSPAAQVVAPAPSDPAAVPAPQPAITDGKRTYTPADFARFAPKTGYDMLAQVPGFTIRVSDGERGLGQASENVLINGQRIANKSGGAVDQLRSTPAASVVRIEIVDASSLGLAGLVGQVANVVVTADRAGHGQFEWSPSFRAHYTVPDFFQGSISYSGQTGPVDYTVSLQDQSGRGGYGGPVVITGPDGVLIERRAQVFRARNDLLTLKTRFGLDGPGTSVAHLTLSVTPYWNPYANGEDRVRVDGDDRFRLTTGHLAGTYYDINVDGEAALGPGRLKLIGVRHFDHEPIVTTQRTSFLSGIPDQGVRFGRDSRIGETIGRAEYGWRGGRNTWQLTFERAFNTLDQRGTLSQLLPAGRFTPVPYPEGTGIVQEVRYEGTATWSRPLLRTVDLQLVGGVERSTLARVDGDTAPRRFVRPKGSLTLGWRPAAGWDASLKVNRRVGQIDFYDFLAQPNLTQDRQNSGNPDLVPPQSWEVEFTGGRELGRWGKSRLRVYRHFIEDIVDIVPVGIDGQGVGNLPRASRFGAESTSTIQFDPVGWTGAKLDATFGFERTRVRDPLTGAERPISGTRDAWATLNLRHDVPHSQLAWGVNASYEHYRPYFYLTEVSRNWEGPVFLDVFVEHKDVFGLTVRATAANVINARHRVDRFAYDGFRTTRPLLFREQHDQLIGPIFQLSVSGTF